jgi:hypothetical protein
MISFGTADFNAKVASFKADFVGHEQLFRYGQFYLTNRAIDDVTAQIEQIIRSNIRFSFFPPDQIENMMRWFKQALSVPVASVDLNKINEMITLLEINGDLAEIRALFAPGPLDTAQALNNFNVVWNSPDIGAAPPWLGIATFRTALAALQLEKTKCFSVLRAFARKLHKKRGMTTLPANLQLSQGVIAGASVQGPAAGPLQSITYGAPSALAAIVNRLCEVVDAGGFVQCGLLSGARHDQSEFPNPEHYVMIFVHGLVDGRPAFLFWDPDTATSNLSSTTWGPGFGCLFALPNRFSTGIDDADHNAVDTNLQSMNYGEHLNDGRRHRYQVYYVQTLPV